MGEDGQVQDDNVPGPNPAWNDVLSVIPEDLHGQVTPYFQQWDQSAQSKIEQANAEIKNFEGYKPFVEYNITPEEIEQGLRMLHEINNNPRNVYDALNKAHNFGTDSSPVENTPGSENEEINSDPRYDELKKGLDLVSQVLIQNEEAKKSAQEDAALESELKQLRDKFGDYDEEFVLSKMSRGASGEEAVQAYNALVNNIRTSKPQAPNILGGGVGGNGVPSNQVDPRKLTPQGTRDLVAQMLNAANRET